MTQKSTPFLTPLLVIAFGMLSGGCETTLTPLAEDATGSDAISGDVSGEVTDTKPWDDATPIGQDAPLSDALDSATATDVLDDSDASTKYTECDEDSEC